MEADFLSITTNVKPKVLSIQRLESFSKATVDASRQIQ